MSNRAESDRRYQEKLKAEREELASLQKEKSEWEAEKRMVYTTLQTGVNDLIDKYNDLLKYVFDEEDEIDQDMIESLSVTFIQLPDIEITNEAVTNVEDTHGDGDEEASQKTIEEKDAKNEPTEALDELAKSLDRRVRQMACSTRRILSKSCTPSLQRASL